MDTNPVTLIPLQGMPLIQPGDDLVKIILEKLAASGIAIKNGDILSITQKIVSKAEGAMVGLNSCRPSPRARRIARLCAKDPRLVEIILRESKRVVRHEQGKIITEHNQGWICANAGIDRSNVSGGQVTLIPKDSDQSAKAIRRKIKKLTGIDAAVIIIDSHGRPFRRGSVGVALGCSGIRPLVDKTGSRDLFRYRLKSTQIALADELAAATSLLMGQANEGIPVVIVRGLKFVKGGGKAQGLIRTEKENIFK